jgi:endogenous inhibitor of DNA gyrase (YacG/DUF329 family)
MTAAAVRTSTIDLNRWHHAIHQVTGDMAVRFNGATLDDLRRWARMLRVVADEMDAPESVGGAKSERRTA